MCKRLIITLENLGRKIQFILKVSPEMEDDCISVENLYWWRSLIIRDITSSKLKTQHGLLHWVPPTLGPAYTGSRLQGAKTCKGNCLLWAGAYCNRTFKHCCQEFLCKEIFSNETDETNEKWNKRRISQALRKKDTNKENCQCDNAQHLLFIVNTVYLIILPFRW